jgi:hypothetical protein
MKRLLALFLLCLAIQASALELAGFKLDDQVEVADARLLLNGAGVRTMFISKVYVAGLYLELKTNKVDEVLADGGPKRLILVMERNQDSKDLVDSINNGFTANNNAARMQALQTSLRNLSTLLEVAKEFKEGDVITIDYVPSYGTYVGINGVAQGHVEGGLEFYDALRRVWLGEDPVDSGLKHDLLGNAIQPDMPVNTPIDDHTSRGQATPNDGCCL